jgi:hypothetical protein
LLMFPIPFTFSLPMFFSLAQDRNPGRTHASRAVVFPKLRMQAGVGIVEVGLAGSGGGGEGEGADVFGFGFEECFDAVGGFEEGVGM